jgi:hypothetical protein
MSVDQYIPLATSLATLMAALTTLFVVLEMRKQRETAYKSELYFVQVKFFSDYARIDHPESGDGLLSIDSWKRAELSGCFRWFEGDQGIVVLIEGRRPQPSMPPRSSSHEAQREE